MRERWRPIPNHDGYHVSDRGRVKGKTGKILALRYRPAKKRRAANVDVSLGSKRIAVHRLVAIAFIGPPPFPKAVVRHLDGDGWRNYAANLAWGTQAQNVQDSLEHGTHRNQNTGKTHCKRGHLLDGDNLILKQNGKRNCRACKRMRQRKGGIRGHDRWNGEGRERPDQPAAL